MSPVFSRLPMETVDPEQRGVIGIRVEIADLGSCLTACVPDLPATGLDGMVAVATALIGAALVAGGILFAVTHRRFSGRATDAR